jgi:putative PIN family toxin of toxin-antitoxin system
VRLVLDSNIVISGLLWDGAPRRLLNLQDNKAVLFFTSEPLLAELASVLGRRKFANKIIASGFTMIQLVDLYAWQAEVVEPLRTPRTAPDPDDDVVIGTALAAGAGLIVTGDKGLLSVGEYHGGRIVGVADALRWVLGSQVT